MNAATTAEWVHDARERTMNLVVDLDDFQIMGPQLDIINPLLWEIGHVSWFTEKWVLRDTLKRKPIIPNADELWDSIAIAHDHRWELPLLPRNDTLQYLKDVRDEVLNTLQGEVSPELLYRVQYCIFHEDMHTEAFTYSRQTLGYPRPVLGSPLDENDEGSVSPATGDARVVPGVFMLGASKEAPFVFDNEMWEHPVTLAPFSISRTSVTQSQFAEFVDDGGYDTASFWTEEGWDWKNQSAAQHPVYWRRDGDIWLRRDFDRWFVLEPNKPVIHVNWYEANAYCRWANRRLPTEAEWEATASLDTLGNKLNNRFPWGDADATPKHVNMDWQAMGCVDVNVRAAGDSAAGCRQMIGNVWEWTSEDFEPYPGFRPDFYKEYSEPWFGTRKVLRGGCWATRSRMLRNTWRNFYEPHRRDVFAGFRTCAKTM